MVIAGSKEIRGMRWVFYTGGGDVVVRGVVARDGRVIILNSWGRRGATGGADGGLQSRRMLQRLRRAPAASISNGQSIDGGSMDWFRTSCGGFFLARCVW